jgi:purine-binding chemotaxis protein CheW
MTDQFCTFYLQRLYFGIEVSKVQEVMRHQAPERVPLSAEVVEGLINLRGQIVTVIDLRRRLGLAERQRERFPMHVVVRTDEGPVSLLVDEIGDVLDVDRESFEAPPESLRGVARELIVGAHKLEGKLLLVLDMEKTVDLRVTA